MKHWKPILIIAAAAFAVNCIGSIFISGDTKQGNFS